MMAWADVAHLTGHAEGLAGRFGGIEKLNYETITQSTLTSSSTRCAHIPVAALTKFMFDNPHCNHIARE